MFLPVCLNDLKERGWDYLDFIYVNGDAYCDHPSFGVSIITRVLEAFGYKVGIISQPDWTKDESFLILGKPRLGFLVSSGNIDSIVNHYTVSKHKRKSDAYTEGGIVGKRPDYAVCVYSKIIKRLFPTTPIIIGGIEASLRRLCHYDYLKNTLLPSILIDSNADIISYGMGEKSIVEICDYLNSGLDIKDITFIRGTVFKTNDKSVLNNDCIYLPSFNEVKKDKLKFIESFKIQYNNLNPTNSKQLVETYNYLYIVQNIPSEPLSSEYMDWVYSLDYQRKPHPMYKGEIKAISEVKFSITSNRGCLGSCSFCALNFHQGRLIQKRSKQSILDEVTKIIKLTDFKGYIHDIGGPTANFYSNVCSVQESNTFCNNKLCLYPKKCSNLKVSHSEYLDILRSVRKMEKVKKVFVRSGIRYDYLISDPNEDFFKELVNHHISGQLKVAPEHVSSKVLNYMQKPTIDVFEKFSKRYYELNKVYNKKQYLVPYLMSSHPGCELSDAIELAVYLHENKIRVEQVQDFYPTPGTLATCMYYTEKDINTLKDIYVPKSKIDKAMQRALIQYYLPQNYNLVLLALTKAKRFDLIGFEKKCLIKPLKNKK